MTAAAEILTALRASALPVEAQAFLAAVNEGETPALPDGQNFRILYSGGDLLNDADPNVIASGKWRLWNGPLDAFPAWNGATVGQNFSTAAGAWQDTHTTWKDYAAKFGISDFQPQSQVEFNWKLAVARYPALPVTLEAAAGNPAMLALVPAMLHSTWKGGCDSGFPKRYANNLAALKETPVPVPIPIPATISIPISELPSSAMDQSGNRLSIKYVAGAAAALAIMFGPLGPISKADGDLAKPPGIFALSTFRFAPGPFGDIRVEPIPRPR